MHPLLIVLLLVLVVALLFAVVLLARSGWGAPGEDVGDSGSRRTMILGVALITGLNLVLAGTALYVAQSSGNPVSVSDTGLSPDVQRRMDDLEARLADAERALQRRGEPVASGPRIDPTLRDATLRAKPAGEALTKLAGGTAISVLFCMDKREAGQYWCEVRTDQGDTGWVPRPLIRPTPEL